MFSKSAAAFHFHALGVHGFDTADSVDFTKLYRRSLAFRVSLFYEKYIVKCRQTIRYWFYCTDGKKGTIVYLYKYEGHDHWAKSKYEKTIKTHFDKSRDLKHSHPNHPHKQTHRPPTP